MIDKKAFQVQYHYRICMNKHPCSNRAISSCEMARTLLFIYGRFDGNSSADMLEKSTSDLIIKKRQASQKKHVLSLRRLSQLSTRSIFYRLKPIAVDSTFRQLWLVRSLLYFHFWFASFASSNWSTDISMVQAYSQLKELHQGRCLHGGLSTE